MLQRMNIAALFIRRPVATALIMLGMLFFGAASYVNLPVNQLPNVDFPTIQVSADLSGADPETMAASVATPLEKEFFTIAGIDSISSVNATAEHASPSSSPWTVISTPRPWTCRPPSVWPSAVCLPT